MPTWPSDYALLSRLLSHFGLFLQVYMQRRFTFSAWELVTSAPSHHELVYARAVVIYNSTVAGGGVKPDLMVLLADL